MNSPANRLPTESNISALVQLHAAEYAALTNRITYIDLFNASIWTLIVAFITLMANAWDRISGNGFLVWACATGVQLMLLVASIFVAEHYTIVLYLETELHDIVARSGIEMEFWSYERFLAGRRKTALNTPWEWFVVPIAVVPMGFAIWSRSPHWQQGDYLGIVPSAVLLPILGILTARLIRMRNEWTKAASKRPMPVNNQ